MFDRCNVSSLTGSWTATQEAGSINTGDKADPLFSRASELSQWIFTVTSESHLTYI